MEPIKIEAVREATGVQIESFDAEELFERAGAALSANRFDEAASLYTKLLTNFPESSYARPALYNRGLAFRDKKDWPAAIESFKALAEKYREHVDAKDAMFQLGACYAEIGNWPASAEIFVRLQDRKDLNADDRIEALARRGFAQFNLSDFEVADKTFRSVFTYKQSIERDERLATDFYLAFSQYHLGQISHQRFRLVKLQLPETQMDRDLDEKARLLLQAQRSYIETIKFGNPAWASAAGFQVGSLYEELYDSFMSAPIPPGLDPEARHMYLEELQKKIRVLLEKSLRWQRENLLMIERLGVNTDWAEKSKLAYAKLLKLLDPNTKYDQLPPPSPVPNEAPRPPAVPTPRAPSRPTGPMPQQTPGHGDDAFRRRIL